MPSGANFQAILSSQSGCSIVILYLSCTWVSPGDVGDRPWGAVSEECRYDPTPGSTAAWRYGCNLGVDPKLLLNQQQGWGYTTTDRRLTRHPDLSLCKDVAAASRTTARLVVDDDGDAALRVAGTLPPGPAGAPVTVERLLEEEDGAGESPTARTAGTPRPSARTRRRPRRVIRGRHGSPCTCAGAPPVCASGHRPRPAGGDARGVRRGARTVMLTTRLSVGRSGSIPLRTRWACPSGSGALRLARG